MTTNATAGRGLCGRPGTPNLPTPGVTMNQTDPTAALRDRIVAEVQRLHETGAVYALDAGEPERIADAVLAVLPEQADRAAATERDSLGREADRLRKDWVEMRARAERAEAELRRLAVEHGTGTQQQECDHDSQVIDHEGSQYWACLKCGTNLGRVAGSQQQPDTEAHAPEHTWAAELHDPLADEWVPGTRYLVRDRAVNALEHSRRIGPAWKDGTPVERRLVRATTTYTVEEPGPAEQQAAEVRHTGGNAEDCPACIEGGLNKLGYPWECPGPEQQAAAVGDEETPFIPPAHYRRDDGVECCVHTIPVGPNSCAACRELADDA